MQQSSDINTDIHVLIITQYLISLKQGWVPYGTGDSVRKKLSEGELRRLQKLGAYGVEVAWAPKGRTLGRIAGSPTQFNIFALLELYNEDKAAHRASSNSSSNSLSV